MHVCLLLMETSLDRPPIVCAESAGERGRKNSLANAGIGKARQHCSRPSTSSTAPSSAAICSATGTRSSSASSTQSRRKCRCERKSTPSSTTTQPTSTQRCANGWPGIPAGPSTSRPHRHPDAELIDKRALSFGHGTKSCFSGDRIDQFIVIVWSLGFGRLLHLIKKHRMNLAAVLPDHSLFE